MKASIFKHIFILAFLLNIFTVKAGERDSVEVEQSELVRKYRSGWNKIIPRYGKVQYAGSMGFLSFGLGWNYYRNHWETDLLLGFIPAYSDDNARATLTLKQNYFPWNIKLSDCFSIEPLACGAYINVLLDREFWASQPDRYPNGYYWFSTRFRIHIFAGERVTYHFKRNDLFLKSVTLFYEISTCDLYLINKIGNSSLKPKDYLSLSFGAKFQILQ